MSPIERCDAEIAEMIALAAVDEQWVLGVRDWMMERGLIMEQFVADALRTEPSEEQYLAAHARLGPLRTMRLLHSSMGLVTEAGEIMDHLKKHIFYGKPLDDELIRKIISDYGDSSWYYRIGVHALEVSMAESIERNVRELKARFPDKFSEEKALNRDESKEMKAAIGEVVGEKAELLTALDATERCPICDWPMAKTAEEGCVPGNCSYRPEEGTEEYRRIVRRRVELQAKLSGVGE